MEIKKDKNVLQKIIQIILILILVLSTILIGLPQENNISIINILIAITAILSIINNRKNKYFPITITDSVTSIERFAFSSWTADQTIYCEVETQPSGWNSSWKSDEVKVEWGYKPTPET